MAGKSIADRLADLENPDDISDSQEIWATIKTILVIIRVLLFVAIIVISEIMEQYFFRELSLAIWSLIIGIPLFILVSVVIINGDKRFESVAEEDEPTALKHPIRERV
jgi:Na+/H+ antiporter NhaC